MNLGIKNKPLTVKDVYYYALNNRLLDSDVYAVLDIISRERNLSVSRYGESIVNPTNNTSTPNFGDKIEYTTEDVLNLFT